LTCISLCAIFLTKAQTVDLRPTADVAGPVFAHADSLYRAGSYFEASIAYERVLFENTDRGQQLEAVLGKTRCLKMLGSYDQARTFLESWQGLPFPDSGLTEIHYQQVLCTYLGGHFEEVLSLVDRWPYTHAGKSPAPFLIVLKILSLNELQRWKEAAETYRSFIAQMHLAAPPPDLYAHIPHLKDVNKAQWLSQFIPGAGQFYVGKPDAITTKDPVRPDKNTFEYTKFLDSLFTEIRAGYFIGTLPGQLLGYYFLIPQQGAFQKKGQRVIFCNDIVMFALQYFIVITSAMIMREFIRRTKGLTGHQGQVLRKPVLSIKHRRRHP